MVKKPILFSEEEIELIEKKVKELESKTSGELVVQVKKSSDSYFQVRAYAFLLGYFVTSVWWIYAELTHHWLPTFHSIFVWQLAVGFGLVALSYIPRIGRLFVSKKTRNSATRREALACFTTLGVNRTKERTGILVLLSAFERQVVILADEGIHTKVKDGYWSEEAHAISAGFREGRPAESLVQSLERMSRLLSSHFPIDPNDRNELPDDVRF